MTAQLERSRMVTELSTDFAEFVLSLAGFVLSLAERLKMFVLSLAGEGSGSCFHSQNAA